MKKVMVFLFGALLLLSCDSDGGDGDNVNCTHEYRVYGVVFQNKAGEPIILDSTKVEWDGRDITAQVIREDIESWKKLGQHTIAADFMQSELEGVEANLVFTGYLSGKEVFKDTFLFTADRCHVKYIGTKSRNITLEE